METVNNTGLADPKEQMTRCLNVLQEYAKWCLLRGYAPPPESEARRIQLLRQLFEIAPLMRESIMTSSTKSSSDIITEIADHLIQSEGLPPDTPAQRWQTWKPGIRMANARSKPRLKQNAA